jgi:hypothetical protein
VTETAQQLDVGRILGPHDGGEDPPSPAGERATKYCELDPSTVLRRHRAEHDAEPEA